MLLQTAVISQEATRFMHTKRLYRDHKRWGCTEDTVYRIQQYRTMYERFAWHV